MRNHPRILVVDDSPATSLFIAATLEEVGYQVEVVPSGREGLARVARFQPHGLILDVILPDISGYAVCRTIRQSMPYNAPYIILISRKNTAFDRGYGLRQGAHCYLPKPFSAEGLVQAVRVGVPQPLSQSLRPRFASSQEDVPPALPELMPRRVLEHGAMRTRSPFARTPDIEDEQTNRLYTAIDGKRTLTELAAVTGMEAKTITGAIRALLKEDCIRMYDAQGQPVETTL